MSMPPLRRSVDRLVRLLERAWQKSRLLSGSGRHFIGAYVLHALHVWWARTTWDEDVPIVLQHRVRHVM
jgi:hypothetical protein